MLKTCFDWSKNLNILRLVVIAAVSVLAIDSDIEWRHSVEEFVARCRREAHAPRVTIAIADPTSNNQ